MELCAKHHVHKTPAEIYSAGTAASCICEKCRLSARKWQTLEPASGHEERVAGNSYSLQTGSGFDIQESGYA
jgi:hypothetical protein